MKNNQMNQSEASRTTQGKTAMPLSVMAITNPSTDGAIVPWEQLVIRWNPPNIGAGNQGHVLTLRNVTTGDVVINRMGLGSHITSFTVSPNHFMFGHHYSIILEILTPILGGPVMTERRFVVEAASQIVNGQVVHSNIVRQTASRGNNLTVERQLSQIDRITIHHTYPSGEMPTIGNVEGWWDHHGWRTRPGYHFLIRQDGSIWQLAPIHGLTNGAGNPLNFNPGPNTRSIHIAFAGTFLSPHIPSENARNSFRFLCRTLLGSTQLPNLHNSTDHVVGHRTWRNGDSNDCPGISRANYLSWV